MISALRESWTRAWHGGAIDPRRVSFLRAAFFTLLAVDLWLFLPRGAQYGVGDFNVSHFPALDGWLAVPTATVVSVLWLVGSGLCLRIALGQVARWVAPVLAASFVATVMWSLLDGYQHHYLLCQLLILFALVDWSQPRPWAFRLLRVHTALLYGWTAITKLDPVWLDGTLASLELAGPAPRIVAGVGLIGNVQEPTVWATIAVATVVLEVGLAIALFIPRAWPVALPIGLAFHLSFLGLGFNIGLFPLYMCVLLLFLMTPKPWLDAVHRRWPSVPLTWTGVVWPVAWLVGLGVALVPVPGAVIAAVVLFAIGAVDAWTSASRRTAIAHLATPLVLFTAQMTTDTARDYWATVGDMAWRRGDEATARDALLRVSRLDPDDPAVWVSLADFESEANNPEAALLAIGQARTRASAPELDARHDALIAGLADDSFDILVYYAAACDGGDPMACRQPPFLPVSRDQPALNRRCDAAMWDACGELAATADNASWAITRLDTACDSGAAGACRALGLAHRDRMAPVHLARAASLLQRGCTLGDAYSCARVAAMHATGAGVPTDLDAAARRYTRACRGDVIEACANLAVLMSAAGDRTAAQQTAEAACARGSTLGCSVWVQVSERASD